MVTAARIPKPPAALVAAVRLAPETQPIPVCTIGSGSRRGRRSGSAATGGPDLTPRQVTDGVPRTGEPAPASGAVSCTTCAWGPLPPAGCCSPRSSASGVAFLDGTIVNVALPAIADDLDATLGDLQWVLDAYLVTLTALVLLGGSLGDRFGRRRVFLIGLAGFTVGVGPVRAGPERRGADRRPGPAGRGGRPARAGQPGHPLGGVPPRRPGREPSARGRVWAAWPRRSARSPAAGSSTACRGGWPSS